MKEDKISPIDSFFKDLMGYIPTKFGTAYEKISTAAYSIIKRERSEHDRHLKGLTGSNYQIDGLIGGKEMLEAKDYTIKKGKVGRSDLQKQEGALVDLPSMGRGVFASATGYTSQATKYAKGSRNNDKMTSITTYDIRPSTIKDEQGRIKTIHITMNVCSLCYSKGKYSLIFAEGEQERLRSNLKSKSLQQINNQLEFFYDETGNIIDCMSSLSSRNHPTFKYNDIEVNGIFPIQAYVKLNDNLYCIKGVRYEHVPIVKGTESFVIEPKGKAVLLIKSDLDGVNKLITDVELRAAIERIEDNSKLSKE